MGKDSDAQPGADENNKQKKIMISISGKRDTFTVSKSVLKLLGNPPYICLKVNKKMDSFLIEPGRQKEYMSFKVPENLGITKGVAMRMTSRAFVKAFMEINGLDVSQTYHVYGVYIEKNNAVLFRMSDCIFFNGKVARQRKAEIPTDDGEKGQGEKPFGVLKGELYSAANRNTDSPCG